MKRKWTPKQRAALSAKMRQLREAKVDSGVGSYNKNALLALMVLRKRKFLTEEEAWTVLARVLGVPL